MAKILYGARGCSTLLFLVVCTISLSNSTAAGDEKTNGTSGKISPARFFYLTRLTEKQSKSTVTIELNFKGINTTDRTVVEPVYSNVHREILNKLNDRKSNMTATTFSTSIAETTSTSTTPTPDVTSIASTATTTPVGRPNPPSQKKRKKRQQTLNTTVIDETDLCFIEVDPETDENGILAMILLLDVKGLDGLDCGLILYEAVNQTATDGTLHRVAKVPVVAVYRGFANGRNTMMSANKSHIIWPLVVLCVILLLFLFLVIGGIVYWNKRQAKHTITSKPV